MDNCQNAKNAISRSAELIELHGGRLANRFENARKNHMGYPYNLSFTSKLTSRFGEYLINNLGDPYVGSHYGTEVCDIELEVVEWAKSIWGVSRPDEYWGSVVASGTEGNLWAVYLGREALVDPILICSQDAHYSLPKAAKILGMDCVTCASTASGEICLDDFGRLVSDNAHRGLIIAVTCGTTIRGAHDDIAGCIDILNAAGIPKEQRYVHVDGALNAMVVPFLNNVESNMFPHFRWRSILFRRRVIK